MASRVNMKLVVALVVGLAAIGGGAIGLYALVLNKTPEDNVRAGDEAMVNGEYGLAKRMYSRAVNKEPNNVEWLEKWRAAIEAWKPASETEFDNEFGMAFMPMLRGLAISQPTKMEPALEYLGLLYERSSMSGFPRLAIDQIESETEVLLSLMQNANPDNSDRLRLRRFRGLVYSNLLMESRVVTNDQRTMAEEDLKAVLDVSPTDGEVSVGLMRMFDARAREAAVAGRRDQFAQWRTQAMKVLDDHLLRDPTNPEVMVNRLALTIDATLEERTRGLVGTELARVTATTMTSFADRVEELSGRLMVADQLSVRNVIQRFWMLERAVVPRSNGSMTIELLKQALDNNPRNSRAMMMLAGLHLDRREYEEASDVLKAVSELPPLPVSLQGMLQRFQQTQAYFIRADTALRIRESKPDSDTAGRDELLKQAVALRAEFAKRVPSTDTQLLFLDAMIADASGDIRNALIKVQQYNQQLTSVDARGLWLEGVVSRKLEEHGRAQAAFKGILAIDPNNMSALTMLAQTELSLSNPVAALELFERVAAINPNNEELKDLIRRIRVQLGQADSDDPVEQVLINANLALRGTSDSPGSVDVAVGILRQGYEANNAAPRIALQLGSILLEGGDLDGARAVVSQAAAKHPDHERLASVNRALVSTDLMSAFAALVDSTDSSALDKALTKRGIYERFGNAEGAAAMLAEAVRLAPDEPNVIDLQFLLALQAGDLAKAREVYQSAMSRGVLSYNGLVYRARLEIFEGKRAEAMATLTQAIELGADLAPVWRLLGSQQFEAGLTQRAIESFRKAYQIKPNDMANVKSLMEVLRLSNRLEDALTVAREAERFGRSDMQFMNTWLRLESSVGGEAGRTRSMLVREQIARTNPSDRVNKLELASTYIDFASDTASRLTNETRAEYWSKSRGILDDLKAEQSDLFVTAVEARWFADQGRVAMPDGTMIDGIERARGAFIEYIISQGDEVDAVPYIEMARFMTVRGRYGIARQALEDAREHQTSQLEADKVLCMLHMELGQYATAEPLLRGIVEAGADDEQMSFLIQWIEMLLRTSNFDEAQRQVAKLGPQMRESLTVLLQRSELADATGKSQEANELLNRAVAMYPTSALAYTRRAQVRLRNPQMFDDVLIDLQQALTLEPNNTQTLQLRAGVYGSVGRYEDMLRDMVAAVRVNPNLTDVLQAVMIEYILAGQEGRAMDLVEETLAKRPRDLMLMARAARVFDDRMLWARSAELYRRGWELSGDYGFGLAHINALISQTPPRAADAERVLRQIRSLGEPAASDWQVDFAEGAIRMKRGQRNEGEAAMTQVFEKRKSSGEDVARWWRNVRGVYGDDTASLRAYLNRLIQSQPAGEDSTRWLKFFLGQALVQSESYRAEGHTLLSELQSLGSDSLFARLAYRQAGSALYAEGKFAEAFQVWSKGLDIFPGDWELSNNCAFTLATKLDRAHEALPFAKSAADSAPDQPEVYDTLARVYVRLNQFKEAEEVLATATRLVSTKRAEVSLIVTRAELDMKNGQMPRAKRSLERLRLSIATLPDLRRDFGPEIDDMLRRISSLGG